MKNILFLAFTVLTLPVAGVQAPYSAIYLTNNTDMEFDVTIQQTSGEILPTYTPDKREAEAGWTKMYTADIIPEHLPEIKLYSLDRKGFKPDHVYEFAAELRVPEGVSSIAFKQKLETTAAGSVLKNSAEIAGGSILSESLPETTEKGPRNTVWLIAEYTNKAVSITYDRRVSRLFGISYDDMYITLSEPPCNE